MRSLIAERIGKGLESMVARTLLTAAAVGLAVSLLAQPAAGAEPREVWKSPAATRIVDTQLFRNEIEGYVRELSLQMRATLNEDLRRELGPKVVLAVNELRTRS
jgi:hypothetical protein